MSQRRQRPPMFTFVFDGALFKFKAHRPANASLFQEPPRNAPHQLYRVLTLILF